MRRPTTVRVRWDELLDNAGAVRTQALGASAALRGHAILLPRRVRLRDGFVEWTADEARNEPPFRRDRGPLLDDFIRLAVAHPKQDERLVGFVRRYGALHLGDNGVPGGTPPSEEDPTVPPLVGPRIGGNLIVTHSMWHREPVEAWRAWARQAWLIVVLGLALRGQQRIEPDIRLRRSGFGLPPRVDTIELDDGSPCVEPTADGGVQLSDYGDTLYRRLDPWRLIRELGACRTLEEQRMCLAGEVSLRWLRLGSYELRMEWGAALPFVRIDRPLFDRLAPDGVHWCFPALAAELAAWLSSRQQLHECFDCHLPYPVERRRKHGRCPKCRRAAASESSQRSKAKKAAAIGPT